MKNRWCLFIFLTGISLLQAEWLRAQEFLDLWRNPNTNNFYPIQQKFNEYFANRDKDQNKNEGENEGDIYTQFKRWEYFIAPRVYPSGKLINPARLALDEELRYQARSKLPSTAHNGSWESLGIKTYTHSALGWSGGLGRVNRIVPHPTDPQTLFVGTPVGGIWKTMDGGKSWIPLSDGIPVIGVSGIAIDPQYPDSIYILTGDGDAGHTSSIGVLLSTNGGDTWQSTGLQFDATARVLGFKLLMHPTDRNTLFAVTDQGIYKTTDGGQTWTQKVSDNFRDLVFKPGSPSVLYATAFDSYFYTSIDGGEKWTKSATKFNGRSAIGVTPDKPNYVYVVSGSNAKYYGISRSTDGGLTWKLQSATPNILGNEIEAPYTAITQAEYDLAIAVSPTNGNEVHVGGINCWKSLDGGLNWRYTSYQNQDKVPAGRYTHADIHALVFNGNTLYCGSDGGVYHSNDNAANWHDMSYGLEITQFYRIGTPYNDLGLIYGGSQDNGVNKWVVSNSTSMDCQVGGDLMECVVDYTDENFVYALNSVGARLAITQNGGAVWNFSGAIPLKGAWVTPLIMHPTDHTTLYAGYDRVVKIKGGTLTPSFQFISPAINTGLIALGMSPANTSYMYAASPGSVMLTTNLSEDKNSTWSFINGKLPVSEALITGLTVSAVDAKKAWVCFSGYSDGKKVYQTSDAGNTWTNISGTLPNVPVNCILYDNNFYDGVYIGTDIGVFYKDNTMTDWIPFRNGMPNVMVYDLEITNNSIRAATFGRGIWESGTYQKCGSSYNLSGDVTGYQFFEASDQIASSANIKGGIGTSVQYKAVNKITLNPGFKVAPQGAFVASIGNCTGTQAHQRKYRGIYEVVMPGARNKKKAGK